MKKGRPLNNFKEPPRLLGIIRRYRKYPLNPCRYTTKHYAELGIRGSFSNAPALRDKWFLDKPAR
jgi:hypothetical protein